MIVSKQKLMGVYFIQNNITNKTYIGSSYDIARRLRDHLNQLRGGRHHNIHLQRSFDKHGECAFTSGICEIVTNADELIGREQEWLDSHGDMNLAPKAGSTTGWKATEETKMRMSESRRGEKNPMWGKKRPDVAQMMSRIHKGKVLTDEHRRKCSEALKGHRGAWDDPAYVERLINAVKLANTGRKLSDEHKMKISKVMRGRVVSDKTREKHRVSSTGRLHTDETKMKISEAKVGKKLTLSDEERKRRAENGRRTSDNMTPEQKSEIARKAYATRRLRQGK